MLRYLLGTKVTCHALFNMAEPRAHAIKRKLFYYDSSDREDSDVMDSDDSVKDKEYVESESSDNLSQDSSDEVRKEKCGLSPL